MKSPVQCRTFCPPWTRDRVVRWLGGRGVLPPLRLFSREGGGRSRCCGAHQCVRSTSAPLENIGPTEKGNTRASEESERHSGSRNLQGADYSRECVRSFAFQSPYGLAVGFLLSSKKKVFRQWQRAMLDILSNQIQILSRILSRPLGAAQNRIGTLLLGLKKAIFREA